MSATLALSSVKKNAAPGGILKVRYELDSAVGTTASELSATGLTNEGTDPYSIPDAMSVEVVGLANFAVGDGPDVFQTFDLDATTGGTFSVFFHTAANLGSGDNFKLVVVHEYWEATPQDGSSITTTV